MQVIVSKTMGETTKFNSGPVGNCPFVYLDPTDVPFMMAGGSASRKVRVYLFLSRITAREICNAILPTNVF